MTAYAVDLHISKNFSGKTILKDFDLRIPAGQFVALLGKSGSGKTTLLRILAGLDHASAGKVSVAQARSAVFQEPRLIPSLRVWRNVVFGLGKAGTREIAEDALREVGLQYHHSTAWPDTLSGGEAQRVALARALTRHPDLLLLDEPFAALDALTRGRMQSLVGQLWTRHRPAILFITHDVDEAVLLADRILVLVDGRLAVDVDNSVAHPRRRVDPEFANVRARLLSHLGVAPEPSDA